MSDILRTVSHSGMKGNWKFDFDVLLTVHLSIFISVFNQLDAQNLFHNKFYHHTYKCDDTRGCVMQF